MTFPALARIALRIVPAVALAALAGCVAVPVGPGPGGGYAYVPAPVVVAPVYRAPPAYYYRPWGGWR